MSNNNDISLPIDITESERKKAFEFARQQPGLAKRTQVFNNTLAVLTVKKYFDWLSVPTDLSKSDSWNLINRWCEDTADLEVADWGKLECRPLGEGETNCHVPLEALEDRVGYVLVEIDSSFETGIIRGFSSTAPQGNISLDGLSPIEDIFEYMEEAQTATAEATDSTEPINLLQWFDGVFTKGWQAVDELLDTGTSQPAFAFRSSDRVQGETPINLNSKKAILSVTQEERDTDIYLTLILLPEPGNTYLPPDSRLIVFDAQGEQVADAYGENRIEFGFGADYGESFSIGVQLGDDSWEQKFCLYKEE